MTSIKALSLHQIPFHLYSIMLFYMGAPVSHWVTKYPITHRIRK